ncbi:MAG: hypothetical protein JXB24_01255 [Bacteroidales bacterium]|nr:hypothetical protein [Bacteroidales bacterium]
MKSKIVVLFVGILLMSAGCNHKDEPAADRDKFLGTYNASESCGYGDDSYTIEITESSKAENAINICNLWDWDEKAYATVSGNSLIIPPQTLDGISFSGSGSISENTLTIHYTIADYYDEDNCTANCIRK